MEVLLDSGPFKGGVHAGVSVFEDTPTSVFALNTSISVLTSQNDRVVEQHLKVALISCGHPIVILHTFLYVKGGRI